MSKEVLEIGDLDLEETCPCTWLGLDVGEKICKQCEGSGRRPTNFGQEILDFVRKHEGSNR